MNNRPKNTANGLKKEKEVIKWLISHCFEIEHDRGSCPADIVAKEGGRYCFIQINIVSEKSHSIYG